LIDTVRCSRGERGFCQLRQIEHWACQKAEAQPDTGSEEVEIATIQNVQCKMFNAKRAMQNDRSTIQG